MSQLVSGVKKILLAPMERRRDRYYAEMRKRLKNHTPTIISDDCFASLAYHNLGLEFRSPTIMVGFSKEGFWDFVENLEGFLSVEPKEVRDESSTCPKGEITYEGKRILLEFAHLKSFDTAKQNWERRKQRVDFSNIYIVQTIIRATEDDIRHFDSLPYKNKMLITRENLTGSPNVVTHPILAKSNYQYGEILHYKTKLSDHRHMDELDYVAFLNREN